MTLKIETLNFVGGRRRGNRPIIVQALGRRDGRGQVRRTVGVGHIVDLSLRRRWCLGKGNKSSSLELSLPLLSCLAHAPSCARCIASTTAVLPTKSGASAIA